MRFRRGHVVLGRSISGGSAYSYHRLSELELGWAAGLLEGEGILTIRKGKRKNGSSCTPAVGVVSTDRDVIDRHHKLVFAGGVREPTRKTKGGQADLFVVPPKHRSCASSLGRRLPFDGRGKTEQAKGNLESPYLRAVPKR